MVGVRTAMLISEYQSCSKPVCSACRKGRKGDVHRRLLFLRQSRFLFPQVNSCSCRIRTQTLYSNSTGRTAALRHQNLTPPVPLYCHLTIEANAPMSCNLSSFSSRIGLGSPSHPPPRARTSPSFPLLPYVSVILVPSDMPGC